MDRENRPKAREKHVTGQGSGVHKRGSGTGQEPVGGDGSNPFQRQQMNTSGGSGNRQSGGGRRGGGMNLIVIVIVLAFVLLGGGGGLGGLLGGGDSDSGYSGTNTGSGSGSTGSTNTGSSYTGNSTGSSGNSSSYNNSSTGSLSGTSVSGSHRTGNNNGVLNREVSEKAREKYTVIRGNSRDTITILVYMCGTDLESRSGMATSDLTEMAKATLSDQINLLVYTGGCSRWKNNIVSSNVNQIYQVKEGGLLCLNKNAGSGSMTNPDTLSDFISWGCRNYPADRYELILWDHGGGSLSGYGYDEKNRGSGSMSLASLDKALKKAGQKFDFIGFDACLMATVENARMLADYADYMIASEETEPGIGWYYTNWLTQLSNNTSLSTLDIGKKITDDFVSTCARQCARQSATLSVVDLAELSRTLPQEMSEFSQDLLEKIRNSEYKTVAEARNNAREFAQSSVIDQIDFIDFANKMNNEEGLDLADVLLDAVKYNLTSSNMRNAYGLSVYFPYKKMSSVNTAVQTYSALDMDEDFTDCIREFASLELGGQVSSGTSGSPIDVLLGGLLGGGSYGSYGSGSASGQSSYGNSSSYGGNSSGGYSSGGYSSTGMSSGDIEDLLYALLGGSASGNSSLSSVMGLDTGFFGGRSFDTEAAARYLADNHFDASALYWTQNDQGEPVISLADDQWDLIQSADRNLFYDDGDGYIDLGLDNTFSFDEDGNLVADTEKIWIHIDGQPVAYYHLETVEDEDGNDITTGRVPALLNGQRVNLILVFDKNNPSGTITGAQPDYDADETETIARGLLELNDGDQLDFLCDYYSYNGELKDSYLFGETLTVAGTPEVSDLYLGDDATLILYRFTDMYQQHYWTEVLES